MSFIKRLLSSLLLAAALVAAVGCASDGHQNSQRDEGNIPWNRPEKWEGAGAMGSMMQGTQ